ncbi:MAG: Uma2 family endonuclease [Chloroflexota bacterium]
MSAMPKDQHMNEAEYLAFERDSEFKHEFIDGQIYAMLGASPNHNLIVVSTIASLYSQLRGKGCKTYPSDLKVRTPSTRSYVYPDITVVCGDPQFDDDQGDVLLNPTVVIEVLSPNTEAYDRGKKFERYREIASLQEYILGAQDQPHIERFLRQENGVWHFSDTHGLDGKMALSSIGCQLELQAVYEQVTFEPEQDGD